MWAHSSAYYLCTFSGQGSPAGKYHSISLALPSRSGSPACTCSKVGVQSSTFLYLLNQFSQWKDPLVCKLWCSSVSAGPSSPKGSWGHATMPCRLARKPGWLSHPLSTCWGNISSDAHQLLWFRIVPSAPGELSWFPTSSLWSLSLACCAEVVQLTHSCLSGGITALNIGVHLVYWEGVSSAAN